MPEGATPEPLRPSEVEVHAVQFVGTNVEMTWWVAAAGHDPGEVEARVGALLGAKLGLYALTRTATEAGGVRFSVIASPLDRLFHGIGPKTALSVIKQASVTQDLSDVNLTRQAQGLMRAYPHPSEDETDEVLEGGTVVQTWRAWDAGKLLGTLVRRPALLDHGPVTVAGTPVPPGAFPQEVLPTLDAHAKEHGGVRVALAPAVRTALTG
ncbi:MAG: hypothetical protein U5K81_01930 [Trueperaceae bacterium]|nr:hypothetical protein [Trueperaceae bacterium]